MCFLVCARLTAHLGLSHTAQGAPGRKNLEFKQTGAGGSHGAQKEMSHPNWQSPAVAELGAEPGPAARIWGRFWEKLEFLTFISSLLPLRSCQNSHSLGKPGANSTCCFFTPVKWHFLPFIPFKLLSPHLPVYSESQGCLQLKRGKEKTAQNPWGDGKRCSSGVRAIRTPEWLWSWICISWSFPGVHSSSQQLDFPKKIRIFFQLSAPKASQLIQKIPQNQLLNLECLSQKCPSRDSGLSQCQVLLEQLQLPQIHRESSRRHLGGWILSSAPVWQQQAQRKWLRHQIPLWTLLSPGLASKMGQKAAAPGCPTFWIPGKIWVSSLQGQEFCILCHSRFEAF